MARIRTIKPEFWTSAQVMECSTNARLMFIGMWNFADDCGRMTFSPKTIKAQIFPADDISLDTVAGILQELSKNGLIVRYSVEGIEYLYIPGWHHQRIDKPQKAKCPEPVKDNSTNIQRTFVPLSTPILEEGKGEEGKEERKKDAPPAPKSPEAQYFERVKEVLGENAGGLGSKLLTAKDKVVPLARAAIETAATKQNPREYIGAIIRGRAPDESRVDGRI